MRTLITAVLGLLATSSLAAPSVKRQNAPDLYQFQVSSKNAAIDGKWITGGVTSMALTDGKTQEPTKLYTIANPDTEHTELHTWPIGIVDHVWGLEGKKGFMDLVDITLPGRHEPPDGEVYEWQNFILEKGELRNDGVGGWVAFRNYLETEGGWYIKWSDGTSVTTGDGFDIKILYSTAEQ